jgi:hypothetical protein
MQEELWVIRMTFMCQMLISLVNKKACSVRGPGCTDLVEQNLEPWYECLKQHWKVFFLYNSCCTIELYIGCMLLIFDMLKYIFGLHKILHCWMAVSHTNDVFHVCIALQSYCDIFYLFWISGIEVKTVLWYLALPLSVKPWTGNSDFCVWCIVGTQIIGCVSGV